MKILFLCEFLMDFIAPALCIQGLKHDYVSLLSTGYWGGGGVT